MAASDDTDPRIKSMTSIDRGDLPPDWRRIDYKSAVDGLADWALCLPPPRGRDWVVCLHGHGSDGGQLITRPDLRDQWLPLFVARGFGILTPNLRGNAWMAPAAVADLRDLLASLRREFGAARFLFASGSMGGTGNLIYAVRHPEDVSAVVALCPVTDIACYLRWCRERNEGVIREIAEAIEAAYGGTPADQPEVYKRHSTLRHLSRLGMPVYVAHAADDNVVPVEQSRRFADAMADCARFVYHEIPNGGHDAPLPEMPQAIARVMEFVNDSPGPIAC